MHPCLNISEVLTNIFKYVHKDGSKKPSKIMKWPKAGSATLAALARTCKAFSGPALDVLWYNQPSLAPLLNCLPADCYHSVTSRDGMHTRSVLAITRSLLPDDLKRIYLYGKRIRSIGFNYPISRHVPELDPQVLRIVRDSTRGCSRLLPNLNHLRMALREFDGEAPTVYAQLVVGPSLQDISLSFIDYSDDPLPTENNWKNLESLLSLSSSTLTTFTITVEQPYPMPVYLGSPEIIKFLGKSFGHLETLNVPPIQITHDALSYIAIMANLKTLKCSIDSTELSTFNQTDTSSDLFPSLLTFSVDTPHLPPLGEFMKRPGFRRLQSLTVFRRGNIGRWDLNSFLDAFRCENTTPVITSLGLMRSPTFFTGPTPLHRDISPITARTLIPLLSKNMRDVNIDLHGTVEIDDGVVGDLAEAWPNLETLRLSERSLEPCPSVTFDGIVTLISKCPKLRTLSLRFNAKETSSIKTLVQSGPIVPGKNMEAFDVCTSPATESKPWIDLLPRIFPNLSRLDCGWIYTLPDGSGDFRELGPSDNLYYHCWIHVHNSLLPHMEANIKRVHDGFF